VTAPMPHLEDMAAFHQCATALARSFRHHDSELTREQFARICSANGQPWLTMQAYMESAGMKVVRLSAGAQRPGDRFTWAVWEETP
jgi:hypothetical protein